MKNVELVYTRTVVENNEQRREEFSVELTNNFVRDFLVCYDSYKLNCLTAKDLEYIWTDNYENLQSDLCEDEIIDIKEDLKDCLIEYEPKITHLDINGNYGDWECVDDECSIREVEEEVKPIKNYIVLTVQDTISQFDKEEDAIEEFNSIVEQEEPIESLEDGQNGQITGYDKYGNLVVAFAIEN